MADLVSIEQLDQSEIEALLDRADAFADGAASGNELAGKIVALLFYEPSTRTNFSFAAAAQRTGASVIGFQDASTSSASKGETIEDTARVVSGYCDVIVVRHPEAGSAQRFAAAASVPVINAGDGPNEHPTQTLTDLFTIRRRHRTLQGLTVGFVGDVKHGRTVHSLSKALAGYDSTLVYVAPPELGPASELTGFVEAAGSLVRMAPDLSGVIADLDVIYMTRPQKERWKDGGVTTEVEVLDPEMMQRAKQTATVLHPLPRNEEIDVRVDSDLRAAYFEQAANGVPVRMATLERAI